MLNDAMSRMVSLEINAVKRVAEKPSRFDVRLREFYGKHKETMLRTLGPHVCAYRAAGGEVSDWLVDEHVTESLRQLDALTTCTVDELASKVGECVDKWHEERATVVA